VLWSWLALALALLVLGMDSFKSISDRYDRLVDDQQRKLTLTKGVGR